LQKEKQMNKKKDSINNEIFAISWIRLLLQGILIILVGVTLAISSVVNSDAVILSAQQFSWLPASGFFLLALGLQECLEAFFAKDSRELHQNLQVGILDAVIGGLIIFNISGQPQQLSLMIAAFLIVRGLVRITLARALRLPHSTSLSLCGLVSIIAGFMICFEWPVNEAWFLSLCLNTEIAFRGWAILMFSLWVKKKNAQAVDQTE